MRSCLQHGVATLLLVIGPCTLASEPTHSSREDQLKAGYVFNFAKFVDWPNLAANDSLTICFLGGAGVREAFVASSASKQVGTHPVIPRAVSGRSTAGCNLVFIGGDAPSVADLGGSGIVPGVLSVGEERDFIHNGGMIELFTEDNRLRFNISLDNVRKAGLKISSSLLQLASHVEEIAR